MPVQHAQIEQQAALVTVTPGKEYRLVVTAVPPFVGGSVSGTVRLVPKRGDPQHKTVLIRMNLRVPPRLSYTRSLVVLDNAPKTTRRRILIQSNGATDLAIVGVAATNDAVSTTVQPLVAGRSYQVLVTMPAGTRLAEKEEIIIRTNDREYSELRVLLRRTRPRSQRRPAR